MPLGELFHAACLLPELLVELKRHVRRLMKPWATNMPVEVHRFVYFARIAVAMVHHGEPISKSNPNVLRAGFEQLAAEVWIEHRQGADTGQLQ